MNRSALALFVALLVVLLAGCQPALDTNRNLAAATSTPAKETVDRAAIEAELLKLERDWAAANRQLQKRLNELYPPKPVEPFNPNPVRPKAPDTFGNF